MLRKLIANFIIIVMLLSLTTAAYAEPNNKQPAKDTAIFQLINNMDGNKTFEPEFIISGRAKEGTVITVYHYYMSGQDESILKKNSDNDGEEAGEWIQANDPETLAVGASGIFAKSVELNVGQNKIELVGKDKAGNIKKETLEIELVDKSKVTDYINNIILKDINKNINHK